MARIKDLKKEQREVRRVIRKMNRQLKEDCFAGRFTLLQTNRITRGSYNGWSDQTFISAGDPTFFGQAGHGYHLWYTALYEIELQDNEQPERTYRQWFEKYDILSPSFLSSSLWTHINNFIVESDFWKKWEDPEYKKTHWFSGKQLEERKRIDPKWASIEELLKSRQEEECQKLENSI